MHDEVGAYIVLATVKRDWLGTVHRAFDTQAERVVRLRVVPWPSAPIDRPAVIRSLEAWHAAVAELQPANVTAIQAVAAHDAVIAIASDWTGGTSLSALLEGAGPLPVLRSHRWTAGILLGLGRLHRAGMLHGNLDPAAIHVDAADEVRFCEPGLQLAQRFPWRDPGADAGWPQGWSPEELRGQPASERSDLYGAGLLFYRMLTGRTAFTGAPSEVMHRMLTECPLPPSAVNPALGTRFDAVVARAMAAQPQARFASATEFLQALNSAASPAAASDAARPDVAASPDIDLIVEALADAIGPMAKMVVTAECRRSTGIDQLTAALAARIEDVRLRNRFLGVVRERGSGRSAPPPAPPPSVSAAQPTPPSAIGRAWPPVADDLIRLKNLLAAELGPMAALLVDRAAARASSRREFVERLSASVPGLDRRPELLGGLDAESLGAPE